jgi:lipopolysaccharide export LptBFGC system permease protein LptF
METIKRYLGMIPATAWVIIALVAIIAFWWLSDDIGSWWEKRKQTTFDNTEIQRMQEIDSLKKERDDAVNRAIIAEQREQAKTIEADLIRQEAEKKGVKVGEAQLKIDNALKEYEKDQQTIEKVKTGEITKFQLCQIQCQDSAELGYPCRANYCDKFKE